MPRPFIPVPNHVSVELFFNCYGSTLMTVLHIRKGTPFDGAAITSLRTAIVSAFNTSMRGAYATNVTLTRIRTKALDTPSSPMEDYSLPTPIAGTYGTGSVIPASNCIALKLSTGLTGRSNRGRIYHPVTMSGMVGASSSGSEVQAGFMTTILNAWTAFKTAIEAWDATAKWTVVSFMTGGVWRAEGSSHDIVALAFVDAHVDSQRRRLTGRGI